MLISEDAIGLEAALRTANELDGRGWRIVALVRDGKVRNRSGDGRMFKVIAQKDDAGPIAAIPDYRAGVEKMLLNEDGTGDGWWEGWEMLKAAHARAEGRQ